MILLFYLTGMTTSGVLLSAVWHLLVDEVIFLSMFMVLRQQDEISFSLTCRNVLLQRSALLFNFGLEFGD